MLKNQKNTPIITKLLLSASIFQLMLICMIFIPPADCFSMQFATLRAYIPEMTEYAVLTAVLSVPIGVMIEQIVKK